MCDLLEATLQFDLWVKVFDTPAADRVRTARSFAGRQAVNSESAHQRPTRSGWATHSAFGRRLKRRFHEIRLADTSATKVVDHKGLLEKSGNR